MSFALFHNVIANGQDAFLLNGMNRNQYVEPDVIVDTDLKRRSNQATNRELD